MLVCFWFCWSCFVLLRAHCAQGKRKGKKRKKNENPHRKVSQCSASRLTLLRKDVGNQGLLHSMGVLRNEPEIDNELIDDLPAKKRFKVQNLVASITTAGPEISPPLTTRIVPPFALDEARQSLDVSNLNGNKPNTTTPITRTTTIPPSTILLAKGSNQDNKGKHNDALFLHRPSKFDIDSGTILPITFPETQIHPSTIKERREALVLWETIDEVKQQMKSRLVSKQRRAALREQLMAYKTQYGLSNKEIRLSRRGRLLSEAQLFSLLLQIVQHIRERYPLPLSNEATPSTQTTSLSNVMPKYPLTVVPQDKELLEAISTSKLATNDESIEALLRDVHSNAVTNPRPIESHTDENEEKDALPERDPLAASLNLLARNFRSFSSFSTIAQERKLIYGSDKDKHKDNDKDKNKDNKVVDGVISQNHSQLPRQLSHIIHLKKSTRLMYCCSNAALQSIKTQSYSSTIGVLADRLETCPWRRCDLVLLTCDQRESCAGLRESREKMASHPQRFLCNIPRSETSTISQELVQVQSNQTQPNKTHNEEEIKKSKLMIPIADTNTNTSTYTSTNIAAKLTSQMLRRVLTPSVLLSSVLSKDSFKKRNPIFLLKTPLRFASFDVDQKQVRLGKIPLLGKNVDGRWIGYTSSAPFHHWNGDTMDAQDIDPVRDNFIASTYVVVDAKKNDYNTIDPTGGLILDNSQDPHFQKRAPLGRVSEIWVSTITNVSIVTLDMAPMIICESDGQWIRPGLNTSSLF